MIKSFFSQFSNIGMLIKYGISGSIAALVQIGTLVFLVERIGLDHILAVAIAFIVSAFVAFTLQKFWTFRDNSLSRGHFQIISYLILAVVAFFLTMFFMYLFVEIFHIWYVLAQIITIGLVTIVTFLTNKNIIFNRESVIFMNNSKSESDSAEYWKKHLLSWEASAYYKEGQQNSGLWDRLSTVFRGDSMYVRMNTALDIIKPHILGMKVLDVGCASGRFPFLLLQAGASKVYGTDISEEAIESAKKHSLELGLQDRTVFSTTDLVKPNLALPEVDLVTALGVIEYFNTEDMSVFLRNLKTKYIMLDFPDLDRKKEFPTWILRKIYTTVNRLPGVFLYSIDEFKKIAEPMGFRKLRLIKRDNFYFVTNLPE